ncbi:putative secretion activating protein|uniref:Putative peptidoglycan binding protein n=1 Tax=Brenneria salicis ATCC 15712 = DSM 30166 TaxID=714314 RepID=A0A366I7D0_9GAMM|nr:N-acetylmuramidase [Brenneria salicis]NMN90548.1 putative secretion activating protein [Brenneria salicis ATCC 15712 = DSM 30166]RBP64878.1 putative peptidoglycan binding protein [Brenneria salicis ATCC 15712 = DSM 30166]RLM31594.1 peptidoglycan-binding protein [Brenneria salicis ATCC 15712 = DSM 30166]
MSQFIPTPAFTHAVTFVLGKEGGYVNDPTDKGGETKFGVSDLRDGVADGMTDIDGDKKPDVRIKDLTLEQASQIYYRDYWYPAYCNDWPDGISLIVFDSAVQHGVKKALQLLQDAAGVTADGIVGPKTTAAVISADPEWLLTRYLLRRARYYADIIKSNTSQGKYLNGWFNRLDSVTNAAREVVGGSESVSRA